eukprot:s6176_g4.t1
MDYLRVTFTPDLPLRWTCVKAFRGIVYEAQLMGGANGPRCLVQFVGSKGSGSNISDWTTEQWQTYNRVTEHLNQQEAPPSGPPPSVEARPSASSSSSSGAAVIFNAPVARRELRVLVSLDFHKVLDLDFNDSRAFLQQVHDQCPGHIRLDPVVVSYSGAERGRQTRATMDHELPGVPVFITTHALWRRGKGAALMDVARDRNADLVCHVDDRWDIIQDVKKAGCAGFHLLADVWLSELAHPVVQWLRSL